MTLADESLHPLAVIDSIVADLRESWDSGHVENLLQAREDISALIEVARMVVRSDAAHRWGAACQPIVEHAQRCLARIGGAA
ncbi:hypothetical protein EO087_00040 [Dyella sp. M7H15-1]|uniref:hypothetical protein n=1 Tax=Dyella sp. M7H15-1 TaxID=2501295 RepID=UPI001004F355|nr:hypothetical protein [Dyella sp. M7H15-1]QAU22559.1 hypothetical protein EO087_00040 [Dyella sp. M7H15-1]